MYTPGQANPFPNRISSDEWTDTVGFFKNPAAIGRTFYQTGPLARPGGTILFTPHFANDYDSGFAPTPGGYTQMTGFFHELEHAANHNNNNDVDRTADATNINSKCTPKQIETTSVPVTGDLTPP